VLHMNSDFPPPLPDDSAPFHSSDHDPVIAVFEFTP
jgi:predicted extracellular nuclease